MIKNKLDLDSIELELVGSKHHDNWCDCYIESAKWENGVELTDNELDLATEEYQDHIDKLLNEGYYDGE